jgi:hypothetical protein
MTPSQRTGTTPGAFLCSELRQDSVVLVLQVGHVVGPIKDFRYRRVGLADRGAEKTSNGIRECEAACSADDDSKHRASLAAAAYLGACGARYGESGELGDERDRYAP